MLQVSDIQSSQEELQEYYAQLRAQHVTPAWIGGGITQEPRSEAVPYLWHWQDLRPQAMRAAELVGTAQAERRVLRLSNPKLSGVASNTLVADHRAAGTLDHVIVRAADPPTRRRLLTGAQQLHMAGDRRHHRSTGPPVGVFEGDLRAGVASAVGNEPLQGGPHLRHRVVPLRGIDGWTEVLSDLVVLFIEPGLQHPHQRRVQAIQPDHRRVGVVGVIVP